MDTRKLDSEKKGMFKQILALFFGKKCATCELSLPLRNLELDHVDATKPESDEILTVISNLQLLCGACNVLKGRYQSNAGVLRGLGKPSQYLPPHVQAEAKPALTAVLCSKCGKNEKMPTRGICRDCDRVRLAARSRRNPAIPVKMCQNCGKVPAGNKQARCGACKPAGMCRDCQNRTKEQGMARCGPCEYQRRKAQPDRQCSVTQCGGFAKGKDAMCKMHTNAQVREAHSRRKERLNGVPL